MKKETVELVVNGEKKILEVEPHVTLLNILRDALGLTGTKEGCGRGDCGACTVLLDGKAINSCLYLAVNAHGKEVLTVEGLSRNGKLDPLQESFIEKGAIQCGYCTPGMLMTAKALLKELPNPTEDQIRSGISGNICRCTGYVKITEAIKSAVKKLQHNEG